MKTIDDFIEDITRASRDLPDVMGKTAESMAATAKAVAQLTIEQQNILGSYSTAKVPAFFFEGKELNGTGASYIASKMSEKEPKKRVMNWADLRRAQGLQTNHVDLTYTGEMWRGLLPQAYTIDGGIISSTLSHNNADGQDKLNWNRQRYGDFIRKALNTPENKALIDGVAADEFNRFLNIYFPQS